MTEANMTDNGDYNELIESYMEAAKIAGFNQSDVEVAVNTACRFLERCESCRHSRAPHDAVEVAEDENRLDIYSRSCSLGYPTGNGCSSWERLEVPEMAEVVA